MHEKALERYYEERRAATTATDFMLADTRFLRAVGGGDEKTLLAVEKNTTHAALESVVVHRAAVLRRKELGDHRILSGVRALN